MTLAHGWNTTKLCTGYRWTVYVLDDALGTVVMNAGVVRTRAMASARARKWVLYYRRKTERKAA